MRTIEEKNRMIANFMGYETYEHTNSTAIRLTEGNEFNSIDIGHVHTKFHTSWDWLMPVVEKISSIFGEWDYEDERREEAEDIFYMDNMFSEFISADMDSIFSRCVQFIEWYNEQK
jgi:hypothetical protein